jgi:hypothetical protein
MEMAWESELAGFLTELLDVQEETLQVLTRKREALAAVDTARLAELAYDEDGVIARLERCLARREELLRQAAGEGLPSDSIHSLSSALPGPKRRNLAHQLNEATGRARLLRHHSLVNWVLAQRTLLHLSQLLEIIATGGRTRPTYCREDGARAGGGLVNQVA